MENLYKKVLIVGAGLAGSTIARILAENSIHLERKSISFERKSIDFKRILKGFKRKSIDFERM